MASEKCFKTFRMRVHGLVMCMKAKLRTPVRKTQDTKEEAGLKTALTCLGEWKEGPWQSFVKEQVNPPFVLRHAE